MELENSCGPMGHFIKEIFKIISFKAKAPLFGQTKNRISDNGIKAKCMGEVPIFGLMAENMRENT